MNIFLHINRKLIFIIGVLFVVLFLLIIVSKQISQNNFKITISDKNISNVDITEPKFSINNQEKKIFITAKEGNFLNKEEILLNNNVKFRSNEFSIETEKVIFNRNKQTAQSVTKSIFKSKNILITSDGFDINEKGNKIIFYGNSLIILK